MVEYTKVNQITKLKDAVKDNTGTTLRIGLKMFNGNNLPHELLPTTRQKAKVRNAFNNNMSTDLKLSRVQTNKIFQSGEFLGSLLSKLATSAIDAGIPKKIHGSGTTTLIISNEEMNDILKIVQALEDSNVLLKCFVESFKYVIRYFRS